MGLPFPFLIGIAPSPLTYATIQDVNLGVARFLLFRLRWQRHFTRVSRPDGRRRNRGTPATYTTSLMPAVNVNVDRALARATLGAASFRERP